MLIPTSCRAAVVLFAILLTTATASEGQGLDPASARALADTLRMLADPAARGLQIAKDPAAAGIDRQVHSIAGSPELVQEVYALAGDVFAELVRSTGGDLNKLSERLEQGQGDPTGFASMLSPQTLQRLRELSSKIADAKR